MRATCILWAALSIIGVNLVFLLVAPSSKADPATLPSVHCWEWWRTQAFVKEKPAPDVVVLGSSLVMIPLAMCDADYLNKDLDAVLHPDAVYMQDRLAQLNQVAGSSSDSDSDSDKVHCFNFGLPGGLVSDDYMIVRALMSKDRHPKLLVLGLTLRDFIEGHVQYAASTTTFKYFQQFFPIDNLVDLSMPQFWQRVEFGYGRCFSLFGRRREMQLRTGDWVKDSLKPLMSPTIAVNPLSKEDHRQEVAAKLKAVVEEGDFMLKAHPVTLYSDNSNEYRKRFQSANQELFSVEAIFLDKLLALAKDKDMKVLIVNMPLTQANMALMPRGSYSRYLDQVRQKAAKYDVAFKDLNDRQTFNNGDFQDTAHMNGAGGRKLVDQIVTAIESQGQLRDSLLSCRRGERSAGRSTIRL